MKTNTIGTTDIEASTIVFGGWAIGGAELGNADEVDSIQAIQAAFDQGINFIDTAPVYGKGWSEQVVGKAIAGRRDDFVIASKVGLRWDCEDGDFSFESNDGIKIYKNLRPQSIRLEVENSLQRLGIDSIDLLQTHWPDTTTPISETMEALLQLKKEGKVRAIGACNVTPQMLQQYQAVGQLDSIQEMYSMVDRTLEKSLLPLATDSGLSVLAYSPLAIGLLTGKIGPERTFPANDIRSWSPRFTAECRRKVAKLLAEFAPLTEKYAVSTAQLVIAWTAAQPCITHVLCGARNPQQAAENAVAGGLTIEAADLSSMSAILDAHKVALPGPFGD